MKLFLVSCLFFFAINFNLNAQTVNDTNLVICGNNINSDTTIQYFSVAFLGLFIKQDVVFDFGKKLEWSDCDFNGKIIKDNDGQLRKFNSIVEGLNYLYLRGWKIKANWGGGSPQLPVSYFIFERIK